MPKDLLWATTLATTLLAAIGMRECICPLRRGATFSATIAIASLIV
ncbi:MAG: hypothetical protein N2035_09020 [Chthoniobacterales bacterium]|nr:hypothetical protein [Chthoniobacterales bacterium]